jgi:hypothetical protein
MGSGLQRWDWELLRTICRPRFATTQQIVGVPRDSDVGTTPPAPLSHGSDRDASGGAGAAALLRVGVLTP